MADEIEEKIVALLREIKHFTSGTGDETTLAKEITAKLNPILSLPRLPQAPPKFTDDSDRHKAHNLKAS